MATNERRGGGERRRRASFPLPVTARPVPWVGRIVCDRYDACLRVQRVLLSGVGKRKKKRRERREQLAPSVLSMMVPGLSSCSGTIKTYKLHAKRVQLISRQSLIKRRRQLSQQFLSTHPFSFLDLPSPFTPLTPPTSPHPYASPLQHPPSVADKQDILEKKKEKAHPLLLDACRCIHHADFRPGLGYRRHASHGRLCTLTPHPGLHPYQLGSTTLDPRDFVRTSTNAFKKKCEVVDGYLKTKLILYFLRHSDV